MGVGMISSARRRATAPEFVPDFDRVVYNYAVDGTTTGFVVPMGNHAARVIVILENIAFASADRFLFWLSEDGGTTKADSAFEHEWWTLYYQINITDMLAQAGGTNTALAITSESPSTTAQFGQAEIIGMGSPAIRTAYRSFGYDGFSHELKSRNRTTARRENALIFETANGQTVTSGRIIVRTYTETPTITPALLSMQVGAAT